MQQIIEELKISQFQHQHPCQIIEQIKQQKQQKQLHSSSVLSQFPRLIQSKPLKKRLLMYKCKICKTSGRKSQIIMCMKCKYYYHKICVNEEKLVEIEKNMGRQFKCEICENSNVIIQKNVKNNMKNNISNNISNSNNNNNIPNKPNTPKQSQVSQNKQQHNHRSQTFNSSSFINISKLTALYTRSLRCQQQKRLLYNFHKRYSYYFIQNKKINFPIDERVLFLYGNSNNSNINNNSNSNGNDNGNGNSNHLGLMKIRRTLRPELKQIRYKDINDINNNDNINRQEYQQQYCQHYQHLLQIQIFFTTFYSDILLILPYLSISFPSQQQINLSTFTSWRILKYFLTDGLDQLFIFILQILLRMYLNDIIDRNKIQNMKFIGGDVFFNILGVIKEGIKLDKQIVIKCMKEILRNVKNVPSLRKGFQKWGECQINIINNNKMNGMNNNKKRQSLQLQQSFTSHTIYTFSTKLQITLTLMRNLCDTDCFKQIIMKKSQQIGTFTKQKGELINQLKKLQTDNISLKEKIKQIELEQRKIIENEKGLNNMNESNKDMKKKYDINVKLLQFSLSQFKVNEQKIGQRKQKLKQITKRIPFATSLMKFLGVDRFKSQYFFYLKHPNRIYVKQRDSFLSEGQLQQMGLLENYNRNHNHNNHYFNNKNNNNLNNNNKMRKFGYYEGKEQINQLKIWLNMKGTNEKLLLGQIDSLQKKQILIFDYQNIQNNQNINNEKQSLSKQINTFPQLETVTREENLQILIVCENMYKQAMIVMGMEKQQIELRQKQMQQYYYKFTFNIKERDQLLKRQKERQKQLIQLEGNNNHNNKQQQQQIKDKNIWYEYFSKYNHTKLWLWNQKIKKFWFQYLQTFISSQSQDSVLQSQQILFILLRLFQYSIKLYYSQSIKKKQRQQKKKQKQLRLLKQQIQSNLLYGLNQGSQVQSSEGKKQQDYYIKEEKNQKKQKKQKMQKDVVIHNNNNEDENRRVLRRRQGNENVNVNTNNSQVQGQDQGQSQSQDHSHGQGSKDNNIMMKKDKYKQQSSSISKYDDNGKQDGKDKEISKKQEQQSKGQEEIIKKQNKKNKKSKKSKSKNKSKNKNMIKVIGGSKQQKQLQKSQRSSQQAHQQSSSMRQKLTKKNKKIKISSYQQSQERQKSVQASQKQVEQFLLANQLSQPQAQPSPQQQQQKFCQICFQNINYNNNNSIECSFLSKKFSSSFKYTQCIQCLKVYHNKCMQEQDYKRYKKQGRQQWICQMCYSSEKIMIKGNGKKNYDRKELNKKQQKESKKQGKIMKDEEQNNKNSKKKKDNRKQKGKKQIINNKSQQQQYQQKPTHNNKNIKNNNNQPSSSLLATRRSSTRLSIHQSSNNSLSLSLSYNSNQHTSQQNLSRRMTRNKNNRNYKRIIQSQQQQQQGQGQRDFYQQKIHSQKNKNQKVNEDVKSIDNKNKNNDKNYNKNRNNDNNKNNDKNHKNNDNAYDQQNSETI